MINKTYDAIYNDTRSMILVLSGLSVDALTDAALELEVDYELFCKDYREPYFADAHIAFSEMLRQWGTPWGSTDGSSLNGLTMAQFFLACAWTENDGAKYCLDGEAVAQGWKPMDATQAGVNMAVTAAKSLAHARLLMATGANTIAQESLE